MVLRGRKRLLLVEMLEAFTISPEGDMSPMLRHAPPKQRGPLARAPNLSEVTILARRCHPTPLRIRWPR